LLARVARFEFQYDTCFHDQTLPEPMSDSHDENEGTGEQTALSSDDTDSERLPSTRAVLQTQQSDEGLGSPQQIPAPEDVVLRPPLSIFQVRAICR
jgi:hypothetical protein